MPKVSVIVTTYNRKEFLQETIQSVINQTFQDFELIVVDNYSNYDFFEHIQSFNDPRIRAFQNKNNGIIAVNRNFGIKRAKGEYIAFCDDDDVWMNNKIEIQIVQLEAQNKDLIYSNSIVFFEAKKQVISHYYLIDNIYCLLYKNKITLSSVLVRTNPDLFFDETKDFVGIEDYLLWIKLIILGYNFTFISEPLLKYRVLDLSYSRQNKAFMELKTIMALRKIKMQYIFLDVKARIIINYLIGIRLMRYFIFLFLKK